MKLLKYIVFVVLFSVNFLNAQQFNFKTTSLSVLQKNRNGDWGKWTTPKPTNIIVKLDYEKNKIVIYSSEIQHYRIVEYLPKETSKTDEINSYLCKNIESIPVKISFIVRKDLKNKTQLYVYNEDFIFCYDIVEMIE
ncbi:hypothetical protein SY27_01460 [Flavobacterium sp. 316]|uniref:Uncharacterized protein n=1 Tax=Flavobacterium sediminilitoris TaxID=2024526 RepID=A0ABY4HJA2_9FLAO|nr:MULTISPECIES: hypothetical protein [Flavobacterium]KIX22534.1 hypothetical protein SY27_01460 [Flavobacterium sp. 316]UOX32800.1 hypothetical protein LXD69_12210 [Flavobacterium sediminilitoris]